MIEVTKQIERRDVGKGIKMDRLLEYRNAHNIGAVIREKRISKGLTQGELSKQANITRTFLNLVEHGHRRPSLNTLEIIASRLNEEVSELIAEAQGDGADRRVRLAYLLTKLVKSNDKDKLDRLLDFVRTLDSDEQEESKVLSHK